ncbi:MAG: phytochelatin synthase family protein [Elusimicrobiales bacterium]|nr:phytochelatin synthase family protein [Elusimicrobiales bacterium]
MKFILPLLVLLAAAASAGTPKYSPVGGALAVPVSQDNAYFRNPANTAYDYWNLSGFYIPQTTGASCSAASVAMALNALLSARRERGDEEENITEGKLVEKVSGIPWKSLVSEEGADGKHGLTLAQLAAASKEALAAYGAVEFSVSSVTVSSQSAAALESFRRALAGSERNPQDIMLLHFAQDALTGAPGGPFPHISPVGAYDEKTRRVLIFDVDRQWYEPYWAADVQVFKAMAVKTEAFGCGGYVLIKTGN